MGWRVSIVAVVVCCAAAVAGCGGSQPEGGEYDPQIAEEFVKDKVIGDVQANVAFETTDLEQPVVSCDQNEPTSEDPADVGIFTCDASVDDTDGKTVGRETWKIGIGIDPATSDSVVRSSERLKSTIGEAPQPRG